MRRKGKSGPQTLRRGACGPNLSSASAVVTKATAIVAPATPMSPQEDATSFGGPQLLTPTENLTNRYFRKFHGRRVE